jgi:hypothetical protein
MSITQQVDPGNETRCSRIRYRDRLSEVVTVHMLLSLNVANPIVTQLVKIVGDVYAIDWSKKTRIRPTRIPTIRCADHATLLYPQKLALTLPKSGGHSAGIFCSRTKATEFFFLLNRKHHYRVLNILPSSRSWVICPLAMLRPC